MDYKDLFYWMTVAENAKNMFVTMIIVFSIIAGIASVCYLVNTLANDDTGSKMSRKWMWWSYPFVLLAWSLYIFTPSKKDAILIVAGGTTMNYLANDVEGKKIPKEIQNFVMTEIKLLAKEAKVEIGILSEKDRILDKVKKMSSTELIKELKNNPELKKIILKE